MKNNDYMIIYDMHNITVYYEAQSCILRKTILLRTLTPTFYCRNSHCILQQAKIQIA